MSKTFVRAARIAHNVEGTRVVRSLTMDVGFKTLKVEVHDISPRERAQMRRDWRAPGHPEHAMRYVRRYGTGYHYLLEGLVVKLHILQDRSPLGYVPAFGAASQESEAVGQALGLALR